jgi:hypothetical protein
MNLETILTVAAAIVVSVPLVQYAVGSAIHDQRRAAEREREAALERRLKPIRAWERELRNRQGETRRRAEEARERLPVWNGYPHHAETTEAVQAYARQCLKDRKGTRVPGVWRIKDFDDAAQWLDQIAVHYFFLEMAEWELRIAEAHLATCRVAAKIARLEDYDYQEARQEKRRAKKAVVCLRANLAAAVWELEKYLNYCLIMHEHSTEAGTAKAELADERAAKEAGPQPVMPKASRSSSRELRWSTYGLGDYVHGL